MKLVRNNETKKFKNSDTCIAIEYPMKDKDINGAVIKLKGRYPIKGFVVNLKCKELAYIIRGSLNLTIEDKEIQLTKGDLVLIEPGEKYFWDGEATMFVPSSPAWYPEQHKDIK